MSTQNIKDTLAPRETNGHVVFPKKLHWLKKESQVEAYVDEIIRPRQVEYYWPEKDDRAKKAKQQNMGYVWIVCENKCAAKTLVKEINLEERKREFYGRTLEAVHITRRPRLPLQNRHPTNRPHHKPPSNTPSASAAPPPASNSHLTSEDPACDTAHMRPSHATTTPANTHAVHVANIIPTMTGDALVDSQCQNKGGGLAGEDSASESTEEDSYSDVESLGLELS
ncbi:unnamed protein product [Colletotrichum noveboracense]|uniref:Uncharacterized protein n=1 Tax=Colletotrichum noveboracense TaxID=2664923 RepID=A0A9W4WBW5_9PEZI|nr:hypothetical protein CBS470a_003072 [Colletotrichum nupharicola]KAJ0314991.1 hypothetical protein Brms1b_006387 [Colletotrichum noveboracense]CAI0643500.1 unnamed protein product [Colletotrichum noveboracense]